MSLSLLTQHLQVYPGTNGLMERINFMYLDNVKRTFRSYHYCLSLKRLHCNRWSTWDSQPRWLANQRSPRQISSGGSIPSRAWPLKLDQQRSARLKLQKLSITDCCGFRILVVKSFKKNYIYNQANFEVLFLTLIIL